MERKLDTDYGNFLTDFGGGGDRFATDQALDEIHKVLKPGNVFGMIWNIDDCKDN